jgi:5-deoxy-glucuronate isomerase
VYLPPDTDYRVDVVDGPAEIAVVSALAPAFAGEARAYRSGDVPGSPVGSGCTAREAWGILEKDAPASRLIFGEVLLPPGRWGSAHKHDAFNPPHEAPYEEVCHFWVSPAQGFGVIRIYTGPNDPGPMDEVYVIQDRDTVVIPRGYHTIAAGPGCTVHCTYALAGDFRLPGAVSFDPAFDGARGA